MFIIYTPFKVLFKQVATTALGDELFQGLDALFESVHSESPHEDPFKPDNAADVVTSLTCASPPIEIPVSGRCSSNVRDADYQHSGSPGSSHKPMANFPKGSKDSKPPQPKAPSSTSSRKPISRQGHSSSTSHKNSATIQMRPKTGFFPTTPPEKNQTTSN